MHSIASFARRSARPALAAVSALSALSIGATASIVPSAASAQSVRPLASTRTVLSNGLVLLLNEDHSSPVVAVDLWYHVGAKDEQPGHTALAHLCEHLMGQGSPNQPLEPKLFITPLGGRSLRWAETTEDITHYFTTVPSNQLETILWMESDRMAAPLTRADAAHLEPVREVIRQEHAQQRDNPVYGMANSLVVRELLDGPYQIDPVGDPADLNAATADEARAFCAPYYVPNNAVLAISGDLNSARTTALVQKYFGSIPRGAAPTHPRVTTPQSTVERRIVLEDSRAKVTQFRRIWAGASYSNPDRLALLALAAVLTRDRVGRLSKALVYDHPLAAQVLAGNSDVEQSGVFEIMVFPRPNASLTAIEQVVDSVMADVREHGITAAELEPYKKSNAVQAVTALQSREARADTLAHDEIFAHDPNAYAKQVEQTSALTPADILRVARAYLGSGGLVMSLVPAGKLDLIAKPELPYKNVTPAPVKVAP